jgi:hypothetical protein
MGCKGSGDAKKTETSAADLDQRCERLGKACGDNDKHAEKVVTGCKQAMKEQVDKGCIDKAIAAYDCYEKELCGKTDKIWAVDDLRVLAERTGKCGAERDAVRACVGK